MSLRRILVALDGTQQADEIFSCALEQCGEGSCLLLVHCLTTEVSTPTAPFMGIGTLADVNLYSTFKEHQREKTHKALQDAEAWLQQYCQRAQVHQVPAESMCKVGEAGPWICDVAKNWKADLIVIGRRGRTGLAELVLGSVSNYVVHEAPCSVLVIQGHASVLPESSTTDASTQHLV